MECRKVHGLYGKYLEGSLPDEEMKRVANHTHDCPDCFLLDAETRKHFVQTHTVDLAPVSAY